MARSTWKNSYVSFHSLRSIMCAKVIRLNNSYRKSGLLPDFLAFPLTLRDNRGKVFEITDLRVGQKIGSFLPTRLRIAKTK